MNLGPYTEMIRSRCERLSREQLLDLLAGLGASVPAGERTRFLQQISALIGEITGPRQAPSPSGTADSISQLVAEVESLKTEIRERIASIEDGDYFDDYDAWDEYDSEEEPAYHSDEQADALEDFFSIAGEFFLSGDLKSAHALYQSLFELFGCGAADFGDSEEDEESFRPYLGFLDLDLDVREAYSRFCRCVYEVTPRSGRAPALVRALVTTYPVGNYPLDFPEQGPLPMLEEVRDSLPTPPSDWESFLPAWRKELSHLLGDRAHMLLLEVTHWLGKTAAVAELARTWGADQPHGFLFWMGLLARNKEWRELLAVGNESLDVVKRGDPIRLHLADLLLEAAEHLGDHSSRRRAVTDKFVTQPSLNHLQGVVAAAGGEAERRELMNEILPAVDRRDLQGQVRVLLAAGRIEEAFASEMRRKARPIGWSSAENPGGVLFASILIALSEAAATRTSALSAINDLFTHYADRGGRLNLGMTSTSSQPSTAVSAAIREEVARFEFSALWRAELLAWVENLAERRIDEILSNKFRGAYVKAAHALVALVQFRTALGDRSGGSRLLHEFRNQRYSRYSAFKKELDGVCRQFPVVPAPIPFPPKVQP